MSRATRPPDFVGFCGQDWWYHNQAHSDFQLLLGVDPARKVLMINSLGMRMPTPGKSSNAWMRIRRKLKSFLRFVRRAQPERDNVWVLTPVSLPLYGNAFFRWLNAWSVALQVRFVLRLKGFNKPHVMVTVPTAIDAAERIPHRSLVYNRSDKHSLYPEADTAQIQAFERALFERADRVLYVSHALMEEDRAAVGERAFFLDHGVVADQFHEDVEPHPEVLAIPGPRIGFFGSVTPYRLDFELLHRIPRELPHAQLVMVGSMENDISDLLALPNVHHLGFRPHSEIPSIGRAFDVALMPWPENEWIYYCNPIKLKEYLCLGLEVVTTYFPEVDHYADVVHVARDRDHYLELLAAILEGRQEPRNAARRAEIVAEADWRKRSAELVELCDEIAGRPSLP